MTTVRHRSDLPDLLTLTGEALCMNTDGLTEKLSIEGECISRDEKDKATAASMRARLRPFDEWAREKDAVALVEKALGITAADFYAKFVGAIKEVALDGTRGERK